MLISFIDPNVQIKRHFYTFAPFLFGPSFFHALDLMEHIIFVVLENFVHQKCTGEISTDNPISRLLKKIPSWSKLKTAESKYFGFFWAKKSVLKICYYLLVKLML